VKSQQQQQQQNQVDLPTSSAQPTSSTTTQSAAQQAAEPVTTSRKRRKQEFKKIAEDHQISYNSNPLSNNSALAYSVTSLSPMTNRYLGESPSRTGKLDSIRSGPDKHLIDNSEASDDTMNDELITTRFTKKIRSSLYEDCPEQQIPAVPVPNQAEKSMQLNPDEQMLVNEVKVNDSDDPTECLDDATVQLLSKG
jgi:hypothetical protein